MLTLNDTPTIESDVKWVVRILGDNNTYRMTDNDGGLGLPPGYPSTNYIGDALLRTSDFETLSQITDAVDITGGGNIDQVSSFNFSIIRWSSDTKLDGFMNEFYPATSGQYLVGREVNIGVIWNGTAESNITWFKRFYIEDYDYTPAFLNLYCTEKTELDFHDIPYYVVQKDVDNKISYFPYSPTENIGKIIPVVYGVFATPPKPTSVHIYSVAPGLLIDSIGVRSIFASHQCYDDSYSRGGLGNEYYTLQYISDFKSYMYLYKTGTSGVNSVATGHTIMMQSTVGELFGSLIIPLTDASQKTTASDIRNVISDDDTVYSVIGAGEILALKPPPSNQNLGTLGSAASDVEVYFMVSSDSGSSRSCTINHQNYSSATHLTSDTGAGDNITATGSNYATATNWPHQFGNLDTAQDIIASVGHLPWFFEEVLKLDYFITNNDGSGSIYVYTAFLQLNNIAIAGVVNYSLAPPNIRNVGRGQG